VARAGNPTPRPAGDGARQPDGSGAARPRASALPLPDDQIASLVRRFRT
jgi:hypothetical protein